MKKPIESHDHMDMKRAKNPPVVLTARDAKPAKGRSDKTDSSEVSLFVAVADWEGVV